MELNDRSALFAELRKEALKGRDPACADDTLAYLLKTAEELRPKRILEIGAGVGLTSIAFCLNTDASVVAIEKDPERAARARENMRAFCVSERIRLIEGDAADALPRLAGPFDLIFLDGPKVQYVRYFPHCKRLLRSGGILLSDDVLLFGWVQGEPPAKRRMLAEHLREYLELLRTDPAFDTTVLGIGEGLAVSERK